MKDLTDEEKRIQKAYISIIEELWEHDYRNSHGGRSYEEEQERIRKEEERIRKEQEQISPIILNGLNPINGCKWGEIRRKMSDYIDDE